VLVDAPCSGTGTWRRQPELRWRLTPEKLVAYMSTQDRLLEEAAMRVRAGGRLIYATCSLFPCENEDRIEAFLSRHTEFAIRPCAEVWRESVDTVAPKGMAQFFRASPRITGTDGFFTCVMEKTT
jgi:16S rRNA (cytosine967-C5)-methyltransferase